jgi:ATP-dependent DNA ligase
MYAGHVEERGVDLFNQVCEMDLEGIVCKHKSSVYGSDELPWIKC